MADEQHKFTSHSSGAGKSKIKLMVVFWWDPSWFTAFSLGPHMGDGVRQLSKGYFARALLLPHDLSTSQRPYFIILSSLYIRNQRGNLCVWGEHKYSNHSRSLDIWKELQWYLSPCSKGIKMPSTHTRSLHWEAQQQKWGRRKVLL